MGKYFSSITRQQSCLSKCPQNPSVGSGCTNFKAQFSYCVEAMNEPAPSSTIPSTTAAPTTTQKSTTVITSTTTSNGISTPTPIQTGMVTNCDKFYYVNPDEKCQSILDANGITIEQFYAWNPAIGVSCGGLWAKTYACVHLLGSKPITVTSKPASTTTTAGNGISTPTPTQPGMVGNCNSFYLVQTNEGCAAVASKNGITLSQFYAWNPQAGSDCNLLQANVYACVGIIGYVKPTPTKGNGVTTPTPIQTGMTTSCKTFHYVADGETCDPIVKAAKISLAQFVAWNPAAGASCTGLWAKTYCCIAVL